MDAQHLGQVTPAVFTPRAGHALALRPAQAGNQVLVQQIPTRHGIDAVVDGLVRDGAQGIFGPHVLRRARDLRWRPPFGQKGCITPKSTVSTASSEQPRGLKRWRRARVYCSHRGSLREFSQRR